MNEVIQHLHRIAVVQDRAGMTDRQLLEDYLNHRDESALAALVYRHGPTVWAICRSFLRNYHDAEDAFQATFLVFVRKAMSITSRELLASWLHGVARQTALKARAMAAKRNQREKQVDQLPDPADETGPDLRQNLQPLLDQELSRVPDKYRAVFVLCDLEGKSRREAARQLQICEGTLSSRLTKARSLLAKRLARYGLTPAGALAAAALSSQGTLASVPTSLLSSTVEGVTLVGTGEAASDLISSNAADLAEEVGNPRTPNKFQSVKTLLLILSLMILMGALLWAWSPTDNQNRSANEVSQGKGMAGPPGQVQSAPQAPLKYFTNSIGMKFVWIPPGTFVMGSSGDEPGNGIQHKVTLTRGFFMGVYAVTQEQWQEIMGNHLSTYQSAKTLPIENVSWDDCQEFIKTLREKDRKPYRLPSEAEWEYACRAGTTASARSGATISTPQANSPSPFSTPGARKTTPAGSFPANAWGLHDMHGNVPQWCQDWWGEYPREDVVDPQGPDWGNYRVLRGGSFDSVLAKCRCACRSPALPNHRGSFGFRLCFFGIPNL